MVIAVFLDRDGVITEEKDFIIKKEDLELIANSAKAIRILNEKGYLTIVISNQSAVARGFATKETIDEIFEHMQFLLNKEGAKIDEIYYCPHHPDPKKGKIPEYTLDCLCRKPKPGMIFQAQKDFSLNLPDCFFVGDKNSDTKAGESAGCKTILVRTGYGGVDNTGEASPNFVEKDLYSAVKNVILKNSKGSKNY